MSSTDIASSAITTIGLSVAATSVLVLILSIKRTSSEDKEIKKIRVREELLRVERQKKLGLEIPRLCLYFDEEKIEYLLNQYRLSQSVFRIKNVKLTSGQEINLSLDSKLLSAGNKKLSSSQYSLEESEDIETKYVSVVTWLSDQDRLLNETQQLNDFDKIFSLVETILGKDLKNAISITPEEKETFEELATGRGRKISEKLKTMQNKLVLLTGDFLVKELNEEFELLLDGTIKFKVKGSQSLCSNTGKNTFKTGNIVRASVFGYIPILNSIEPPAAITPIAIHQILQ